MVMMLSGSPGGRVAPRVLAVLAVAVFAYILGWNEGPWSPVPGQTPGWLGLRVAASAAITAATVAIAFRMADWWMRSGWTRWWDPAETPDGDLSWDRLIELVHRHYDPLVQRPGLRIGSGVWQAALLLPAALVVAGVAETIAHFIWSPAVPSVLLRAPSERIAADALANLSGNLTALLALVAAVVSIRFTSSQLRAKVLADNRQEWLGRTRTLMGRVISLAADRSRAAPAKRERLLARLDPWRLELELRLNPSEKDHRLLMYLLRRLTFVDDFGCADRADEGVLVWEVKAACRQLAVEQPARFGSALTNATGNPFSRRRTWRSW